MLSEAFLLSEALKAAGITPPLEHPRVKEPGKTGPCLRIALGASGRVQTVTKVTADEWPSWTVMEGKQNSFPVIRIKEPLFKLLPSDPIWTGLGFDDGKRTKPDIALRGQALRALVTRSKPALSQKETSDWARLTGKAKELGVCATGLGVEDSGLAEFSLRFQEAATNPTTLLADIADRGVWAVEHGRLDDIDTLEILMVGKVPVRPDGSRPAMNVQLAFDVAGTPSLPRGIYERAVRERVKVVLPKVPEQTNKPGRAQDPNGASLCAFTGNAELLQTGPFPEVRFPVLNRGFPLVSMFSDAPCNTRYRLTDSKVVPVSAEVAARMHEALVWTLAAERKGKTWTGVASGRFAASGGRSRETYDQLVAYVDGSPTIEAQVADLFGTDTDNQQEAFEVDAKAVCVALEGVLQKRPASRINLFVLRKVSEGQAQVILAESPTVQEVLDGVGWWTDAGGNVPALKDPPAGMTADVGLGGARPADLVRLLSEEWLASGTRSNKVQGIGLGDALKVMLGTNGQREPAAARMLDLTVRRWAPLAVGAFGARETGLASRWTPYRKSWSRVRIGTSSLGILLSALGRQKEDYMTETAFLVGRLLSLADTLHRQYCEQVRDGSIPPQLVGNALMATAADSPTDALDRLRERITVYRAWADSGKGEDVRWARWAVGRMGEVSQQLAALPLPQETDATFRAQLLLGYMSREPASS